LIEGAEDMLATIANLTPAPQKLGIADLTKRFLHEKEAYPQIEAMLSQRPGQAAKQAGVAGAIAVTVLSANGAGIAESAPRLFARISATIRGKEVAFARTKWSTATSTASVTWNKEHRSTLVLPYFAPPRSENLDAEMLIELNLCQGSISNLAKLDKRIARSSTLAIGTFLKHPGQPFTQCVPMVSLTGYENPGTFELIVSYVSTLSLASSSFEKDQAVGPEEEDNFVWEPATPTTTAPNSIEAGSSRTCIDLRSDILAGQGRRMFRSEVH
jgi:hypothetical protein